MSKQATLITITGPSGFNKGNLIRKIISEHDDFERIISHTDRPKRESEVDGRDFHFVTEDEFTEMIQAEKFVEWQRVEVNGFRYGKTKEDVHKSVDEKKDKVVFTRVNIINLPVFKRHYPNSVSIFIDVKDNLSLIDYLKNQPDIDSEEEFQRRYDYATEERRRRHLADFIVNTKDTEEETIEEIIKIIERVRR